MLPGDARFKGVLSSLLATPAQTLAAALAAVAVAVIALGVVVVREEQRAAPRSPQAQRGRLGGTAGPVDRPSRHAHLSAQELARLSAFRVRARFLTGEPLEPPRWWQRMRLAWRHGYAGWIIAALAGSFSMATHFGAFWLITGGGWPGAIAITLLSTAIMVGLCAWIGLGLVSGQ
jgi:hypothetical protein